MMQDGMGGMLMRGRCGAGFSALPRVPAIAALSKTDNHSSTAPVSMFLVSQNSFEDCV